MSTRSRLFDAIIVRSWWVILIFLSTLMVFDITARRRHCEYEYLLKKHTDLKHRLQTASDHHQRLTQQIASQNDPHWLELMLMRNLGLIPKNSTKWLYAPRSESSTP